MGCAFTKKNHRDLMIRSIEHLRGIDLLLASMQSKYDRQIEDIDQEVKSGIKRGVNRKQLLAKLRKKKNHFTLCFAVFSKTRPDTSQTICSRTIKYWFHATRGNEINCKCV